MKRHIKEITDANDKIAGYVLQDLRYFIEPINKTDKINLNEKSQVFLTIDEVDTEVALSDIFLSIYSVEGDVIRGFSMLKIIDEKTSEITINEAKTKVAFYDKITGVHFKIRDVDSSVLMQDDKEVTTEQMIKYASILEKGKVTAKNAVIEGQGETVEQKLAKAEKEKAELEEKIRLEQEAKEKKEAEEKAAEEEKKRLEIEAKEKEQQEAKEKQEAEEKAAEEEKKRLEIEAEEKGRLEVEARAKAEEEAKKIAEAEARGRADAIKKQLGGQDYLDLKESLSKRGYDEFDKGAYRFFFKSDEHSVYFQKLVTGGVIELEDTINNAEEDTETGEVFYEFTEDGETKNLVFNPKEKEISVRKLAAKA